MLSAANTASLHRLSADGLSKESWTLGEKPLVVGRGESADARIDDQSLSRSHFLIVREAGDYYLVDLNSSNGTRIQGNRVSARKLQNHEIILAGESVFCFSLSSESPLTIP